MQTKKLNCGPPKNLILFGYGELGSMRMAFWVNTAKTIVQIWCFKEKFYNN